MEYLEVSSQIWTNYHQRIRSSLVNVMDTDKIDSSNEKNEKLSDNLKLLETWTKLDQYVTEMPIWPISKSKRKLLVIVINPFIPMLLPILTNFAKSLFV